MTQRDLAKHLGNSYQSVSNYERGLSAPSDDACQRIAALFSVPLGEVRSRWGKYVEQPDHAVPPPLISLEDAIRSDPRLLPEAKTHLINQVGLLLRIQGAPPAGATPTSLANELQATVETAVTEDRNRRTERPCQT